MPEPGQNRPDAACIGSILALFCYIMAFLLGSGKWEEWKRANVETKLTLNIVHEKMITSNNIYIQYVQYWFDYMVHIVWHLLAKYVWHVRYISQTLDFILKCATVLEFLTAGQDWKWKFELQNAAEIMPSKIELKLSTFTTEPIGDKSTLVQVMAWCHQASSHYLSQCWLSSHVMG